MIINFSPLSAEVQTATDERGPAIEVADFRLPENKVVPFVSTNPNSASCEYPHELTPQPGYIAETKAKPFKEVGGYFSAQSSGLGFSVLAKALEEGDDLRGKSNIIDSGIRTLPSEFFPEAA